MPFWGSGAVETGLGGAEGFGEILLPSEDDGGIWVDVSGSFTGGLTIFGTHYVAPSLFVSTNGTVSFGGSFTEFPTVSNIDPDVPVIAPFWGDVDTRLDGEAPESGGVWVDLDDDLITITWDHVGVYRRDAEVVNTFQLQILALGGGDADVIFRYDSIEWDIGTAPEDDGARAGIFGGGVDMQFDPDPLQLDDLAGNSGIAGLWGFSVRDGMFLPMETRGEDIVGTPLADSLTGTALSERILGEDGDDTIAGNDGADTILGGIGDDLILGGSSAADLRDMVMGGDGNDQINGGHGNDELRGDDGNDVISGEIGSDTLVGGSGNDVLSGGSILDVLYGGAGNDYLNGGFGFDRMNGGDGADRFYHAGVVGHGDDWIQDFDAAEGDQLIFGGAGALAADFVVQVAFTPGAGDAAIAEVFVTYRPTADIIWALVDGNAQAALPVVLDGVLVDLLG